MSKIKVWFAASEVVPFIKTGGLADVAGSLPKALVKMGIDVRVVMPKYSLIPEKYTKEMQLIKICYVDIGWRRQYCGVFLLELEGVKYYFLDNEYYYKRGYIYGSGDEGEQFTFFSKAILEILPEIEFKPDIIHCNDWHTGMVSVLLDAHYRNYRADGFYKNIRTVFTIHNLKFQGIFPKDMMDTVLGLSWDYFTPDRIEFNDCINFMKGALVFSDKITTVSRTYADEIKYDFFGENLSGVIRRRSNDLVGIVNGIDYDDNNPEADDRIFAKYSSNDLKGKKKNKLMLQSELGLPEKGDVPLIAIISRMTAQKGFDLIERVIAEILDMNIQLVVLGTGEKKYEDLFKWAQYSYPDKVSVNIKYDGILAQRIYAGSDMFLMPSLFEPCGLSQLFSMRYGTIPIVRETGGLNDTVVSYNEFTGGGNGFTFTNYNAHDMLNTIKRAVYYYNDFQVWQGLIRRCMNQDFSWKHSANEYIELYNRIIQI